MKINDLKNELNNTKQRTENGALGYKTTGKELLDINFCASSLRNMSEQEIYNKFLKAYYEDKLLAIKWLFYLRDVRGGIGERRSFRAIISNLANSEQLLVKELISIIPEYGRYDDLWCLLDTELKDDVVKFCYMQLIKDVKNCTEGKPISLLAKWLPSTFSKKENLRRYAKILSTGFNLTQKDYSKILSKLRNYSNVVECKMSRGEWKDIDYSSVPSKANLLYLYAFMRHDEERRKEYLDSLVKGEAKINAGVLFPHDIVHKYTKGNYGSVNEYDVTVEELWKALPDYVNGDENTIVVADGSGSMCSSIGNTTVTCLDVANALAIYFAERCKGEYKDSYITFSETPELVDLSKADTLRDKINIALAYDEVSNTNIEAVFDLILNVAVKNGYSQEELPKNILIVSDMEFDGAVCDNSTCDDRWCCKGIKDTLFETIADKYAAHGLHLPRLVFWNVYSRTKTVPVKENKYGVALVSGFSPAVIKMVLTQELNPYKCLVEQLNSERYDLVENAYKNVKH